MIRNSSISFVGELLRRQKKLSWHIGLYFGITYQTVIALASGGKNVYMKINILVIEQCFCDGVSTFYSRTFPSNFKPACVCIAKMNIFKITYVLKGCLVFFFQGRIPASENNGLLKSLNKMCLKYLTIYSSC